jgi:hypothetical protein
MLASNHVLAGAAIGNLLGDPVAAVAAGVLSHLVMDAVPHWGGNEASPLSQRSWLLVARSDGLLLLAVLAIVVVVASPGNRVAVAAGALGALAPDLDKPWDHFFGSRTGHRPLYGHRFARFNAWLQRESPKRWWVEALAMFVLGCANTVLLL